MGRSDGVQYRSVRVSPGPLSVRMGQSTSMAMPLIQTVLYDGSSQSKDPAAPGILAASTALLGSLLWLSGRTVFSTSESELRDSVTVHQYPQALEMPACTRSPRMGLWHGSL